MTPPKTPPATSSDSRSLLTLSREHAVWTIQLADTKANVLMAASAILAGLLAQQTASACNGAARIVLFLAIGLVLGSAAAAALTLLPRTKSQQRTTLLYYQAALEYAKWDEFYERVKGLTADEVDREIAGQVWELARIEDRKYRFLRWGFIVFGLGLPTAFVGVVWTHLPCG